MPPIARAPTLMSYGRDEDFLHLYSVQNGIWKAIKDELALTSQANGIPKRCVQDSLDRVINLQREGLRRDLTARRVPRERL